MIDFSEDEGNWVIGIKHNLPAATYSAVYLSITWLGIVGIGNYDWLIHMRLFPVIEPDDIAPAIARALASGKPALVRQSRQTSMALTQFGILP